MGELQTWQVDGGAADLIDGRAADLADEGAADRVDGGAADWIGGGDEGGACDQLGFLL
jgi:hypothetical protein